MKTEALKRMEECVPEAVRRILGVLREAGYPAYLVGGCVRDCLLGKKPHDWDICTDAPVSKIRPVFKEKGNYHVAPTGLKHGTLTVIDGKCPYEITSFRKKENVKVSNPLHEDLGLRDFTINSMAWSEQEGMVDPYGGAEDLAKGVLRCAGSAMERMEEDPLRILRALRFAAQFGFAIDGSLKSAIFAQLPLLKKVAVERITSELYRFMHAPSLRIAALLREYTEVFCFIMPELKPMVGFDQHNPHHIYDVWEHTMRAMEACKVDDVVLRFTVLFHDTGKPHVFTMDNQGIGHFYGHGEESCRICAKVMKRLRFDNKTASEVYTLVEVHDARVEAQPRSIRRWLNRIGLEQFERLLKMKRCDAAGQNPVYWPERKAYVDSLETGLRDVLAQDACFCMKDLAVKGSDLIALGYEKGAALGRCLQRLLDEVIDEKLPNDRDALLSRAVLWLSSDSRLD